MGGCATKPRDLKAEGEAPPPLEEPSTVSDPKVVGEGEKEEVRGAEEEVAGSGQEGDQGQTDENRRRSLGHLFKESEESKVPSETEEITVKEAKGEEDSELKTVEPTHEETSVASAASASEATVTEEKPVQSV